MQKHFPARAGSISLSILLIGLCLPSLADKKSSLLWEKSVPVTPVEKPRRTQTPERKKRIVRKKVKRTSVVVEQTPLLSLRWSANKGGWADKSDPTKMPKPNNPEAIFKVNDHLQLVFEVNQTGYLYIIQEKERTMIFPDGRINKGNNEVKKDQKIGIPLNCEGEYKDKNGNCWFIVEGESDDLLLIFSRDKIDDLSNLINTHGPAIIKQEALTEIKGGTSQQFSKINHNATTVQFTNLNRKDNEELIIETKIRHQ